MVRQERATGNTPRVADLLPRAYPPRGQIRRIAVSYTHLRAHETVLDLVCRLLLEKKKLHIHNLVIADKHTPKYNTRIHLHR